MPYSCCSSCSSKHSSPSYAVQRVGSTILQAIYTMRVAYKFHISSVSPQDTLLFIGLYISLCLLPLSPTHCRGHSQHITLHEESSSRRAHMQTWTSAACTHLQLNYKTNAHRNACQKEKNAWSAANLSQSLSHMGPYCIPSTELLWTVLSSNLLRCKNAI